MRVIELRNYLIRDGMTRDFIRYFEEHFLFSQRRRGCTSSDSSRSWMTRTASSGSAASRTWPRVSAD